MTEAEKRIREAFSRPMLIEREDVRTLLADLEYTRMAAEAEAKFADEANARVKELQAEIDRLTRERDEARAERDTLLEVAQAIEGALRFASAAEVLDENSPIRDGLRAALAQIEQERSEQGKEG